VQAIAESASAEPASLDPIEVAREAVSSIVRITGLHACTIYLVDEAAGVAYSVAHTGFGASFTERHGVVTLDGNTLTAHALRTGLPQYSGMSQLSEQMPAVLDSARGNTFVIVPFRSGGKCIGTVNAIGMRDSPPAPQEVALLQIVADQIGHAVRAAQLHREGMQSNRRAQFLASVSRAFNATLDLSQVLDAVSRRATEVLCDWCVIYLRDDAEGVMSMRAVHHQDPARTRTVREVFAARPVRIGEGIAGTVVLTGERRVFHDFGKEQIAALAPRDDPAYLNELRQVKAWACLPLMSRGEGVGALVIATVGRPLLEEDLEFATAFTEIAASAIENARLYETERAMRTFSEEARSRLEEADRQKDEFLSIASHELRTPLTSAKGFAQVLLRRARRDPSSDPQQLEGLTVMEAQLRRIGSLLNDLLDFSRIQTDVLPLRPRDMDLTALVRMVVMHAQATSREHQFTVDLPDAPLIGTWDCDRIEQIIVNFLENATKYSPAGGPVAVSLAEEDGWATVRVRDHGLGVPPEAVTHLFQRFYRVHDEAHQQINGLGIGLFICREIAARHGGSVGIERPDGPGSVFFLRLRLAGAGVQPAS